MTYAQFLLGFLVVPIAVFAFLLRRRWKRQQTRACAAVCLLAFLWTFWWDNHAAQIKLWTFDPQFAPPTHFIGYLPWEEYAFYGLQGILVCHLVVLLSRRTESL